MKDTIGEALLPTVTTLFSTLTSGFSALGPQGTELIGKLAGIGLAGTGATVGVLALGKAVGAVSRP
ncbi:MAG TPA: hypothetical protein VH914_00570 [Acidimicrobiia bacterium]|jgi:hypothetical protein|nr:hypothetical protein [Acidimicrobiia bacterium]